jgi:hypothetical protein
MDKQIISPYTVFNNWLFDGNPKSKIPQGDGIPDLLKYNSPINAQYMISMFLNQGKLNHFLNEYFNNIGLYYLDREELMKFIKKCVIDFKIQKKNLAYTYRTKNNKLFDVLRRKIPIMKKHDTSLLCEIIDKSEEKENIYYSLGLDKPETIKKQKGLKKETKKEKETVEDFLKNNFRVMKT